LARDRRGEKKLDSWDAISNAMWEARMSVIELQEDALTASSVELECT
jgi:hypothetical protein